MPPMINEASETRKLNAKSGAESNVFQAAEKSAEFFDHLRAHYRETRRTAVEIESDVQLTLPDGEVYDSGHAWVRNVSPSGALLTQLKLSKGVLPMQNFKLMLILKSDTYKGISIEATPVRLMPGVSGLGVKFDEIFVTV